MSNWQGKSAIVTGAASGIGLALSEAMIKRGAHVWMNDVNVAGVEAAADRLGERAHASELDVRDGAAVKALVEKVASEHGALDYMFNNAGIGIGGETKDILVEHYDRVIDINIRGVTNGVAAAFPLMVEQGHGHVVNTASAAGLLPIPVMASYSMSKHAVVGLTKSMRFEGDKYGVRVSALCPTAVETPILDSKTPDDLPAPWRPDIRRFLTAAAGPAISVESFIEYALTQIDLNQCIIVAPARARMSYALYRFFPSLVDPLIRKAYEAELAEKPKP